MATLWKLARTASNGSRMTQPKKCSVMIRSIGEIAFPCGDRAVKAGRCVEHLADWKHARESRRGQPATLSHISALRNHGTGRSASAIANAGARAARLFSRTTRKAS